MLLYCFFFKFYFIRSVGTKEMAMLHSFLAFLTISQRKRHYECVKAAIRILSFIQLSKNDTLFLADFQRFTKQRF